MTKTLALTFLCAIAAIATGLQSDYSGLPLAATVVAFTAYVFVYFGYVFGDFSTTLAAKLAGKRWFACLAVVGLAAPYAIYALGTQSFTPQACLRFAGFILIPTLIAVAASFRGKTPSWLDLLAIMCLWAPFDTGLIQGVWTWPPGKGAYVMNTVVAVDLGALIFFGFRAIGGFDLKFKIIRRDLMTAAFAVAAFFTVALPFGLLTHFIAINPHFDGPVKMGGTLLGIFFFIAVPEEILFRGLIQNTVAQKIGRPVAALIIASIFFGLTHLNNTAVPDWRYIVLATLAGFAYGEVFRRTRSLFAAALVHAVVDASWALFFMTESMRAAS